MKIILNSNTVAHGANAHVNRRIRSIYFRPKSGDDISIVFSLKDWQRFKEELELSQDVSKLHDIAKSVLSNLDKANYPMARNLLNLLMEKTA